MSSQISPLPAASTLFEVVPRFDYEPLPAAVTKEETKQEQKLLARLRLPPFSPSSEQQFESWVDKVVPVAREHRLNLPLFACAWAMAAPQRHEALLLACLQRPHVRSCDDLVDAVALQLFGHSAYDTEVFAELIAPERQNTVELAFARIYAAAQAYARLARRRGEVSPRVSSRVLTRSLVAALPLGVSQYVQWKDFPSLECLRQRALAVEDRLGSDLATCGSSLPTISTKTPSRECEEKPFESSTPVAVDLLKDCSYFSSSSSSVRGSLRISPEALLEKRKLIRGSSAFPLERS